MKGSLATEYAHFQTLIKDSLQYAAQGGADAADALVSKEWGFGVSARKGELEEIEYHQEQGYSITVYCQQRTGSASTTEIRPEAILQTVDKALSIARFTDPDPCGGLPHKEFLAYEYPDLDLYHDWQIDPIQAAEKAIACEAIAREQDKRITESEGSDVSTYSGMRVYGNTEGFLGGYPSSRHTISCSVVAKDKKDMQRDYEYTVARHPADLQDVALVAQRAAQKTLQRLNPRTLKTQQCPVIFSSSQAKSVLGTFIGAISGSALYRKSTFLVDHLGKKIFPDHIHIYEEPHLLGAMGSVPFDYEGVRVATKDFVKEGVLQNYVLNTYAARRLGMQTTANAGGVFNLSISHSDMNLQAMLKAMHKGLLVVELIGQGVRLMTGDYSKGVFGYWVENGEIQYPVDEITVAGNLRDMFAGIVAVGNDVDTRGSIRTGSIWVNNMTIAGS